MSRAKAQSERFLRLVTDKVWIRHSFQVALASVRAEKALEELGRAIRRKDKAMKRRKL